MGPLGPRNQGLEAFSRPLCHRWSAAGPEQPELELLVSGGLRAEPSQEALWSVPSGQRGGPVPDSVCGGDLGLSQKAPRAGASESSSHESSEPTPPDHCPQLGALSVFTHLRRRSWGRLYVALPVPVTPEPSQVSVPQQHSIQAGRPTKRLWAEGAGALVLGPCPWVCTCLRRTVPTCTSAYLCPILKQV